MFAILLVSAILAEGCYFPEERTVVAYDDAVSCLKSIPFSMPVAIQTLTNVADYLESFVFKDRLQSPPEPFEGLKSNVQNCVLELKRGLVDGTLVFNNDYEFHQALSDIFLQYKDPHTTYSKPVCYQKFNWFLPFTFKSGVEGDRQVLYIDHLPPEYSYVETAFLNENKGLSGFYGAKIEELGGVDMDPVTYLAVWADTYIYSSKIRDSRFNKGLSSDFWMRSGRYYDVPERTIEVMYTNSDSNELETLVVNWYAVNTIPLYGEDDFASYCPILDVPWSEEARSYMNAAHPAVRRAVSHESPNFKLGQEFNVAGKVDEAANSSLRALLVGDEISFYLYTPEDNANGDVVVLVNIPSFSPSNVDRFTDEFLEGVAKANEMGITHLIVNVTSNGGGWVTLGYRVLHVIAPWVEPTFGEYDIRHSNLADILLGSALSETVQTHYDPATGEPFGGDKWYTSPVDYSWTEFSQCSAWDVADTNEEYTHQYSQRYYFTEAYDEHDFTEAFRKLDESEGFIYSRASEEDKHLPPQNIIILTDGLCGSTCACMAKRAQESHAAIMVGIGGLVDEPLENMDVASFAGGSVSDNEYMEGYLTSEDYSTAKHIPFPMPTTAVFRFAFEEVYSWDKTVSVPLEFHINPVDVKIPIWPRAGSRWTENLGEIVEYCVANIFSAYSGTGSEYPAEDQACLPWMVIPDAEADCSIQNGQGGQSCVGGTGYGKDASTCTTFMCNEGYYKDVATAECLAMPVASEDDAQGLSTATIVEVVVCAVVIVALIVVAVLIYKNVIKCKCFDTDEGEEEKAELMDNQSKTQTVPSESAV